VKQKRYVRIVEGKTKQNKKKGKKRRKTTIKKEKELQKREASCMHC
jgi:hypothetical protein